MLLAVALAALWQVGCSPNSFPICTENCVDANGTGGGIIDGGDIVDAGPADAGDDGDGGDMGDGGTSDAGCPNFGDEVCDEVDNDCDGRIDEDDPQLNMPCSSNVGECVLGLNVCTAGQITCSGVLPDPEETCDNLDNDCDGTLDEGIPSSGSCGMTDVGECQLGTLECVGGVFQCSGEVRPSIEQCDALDHDCDGNPTNGFDLDNDAQNCGSCGNVCAASNAFAQCDGGGNCEIAACLPNFHDVNGMFGDGCEYGCSFQGDQEACNQADDDCDGAVDEFLLPPDICSSVGECGNPAVTPECTADGFRCVYGAGVEVDGDGNIVPQETLCDNLDNDCDGRIDESRPLKGTPCEEGPPGICRSTGTLQCDSGDPLAPLVCVIDTQGAMPQGETCDNLDNDCDNITDEGDVHTWVDVGGGVEIFAYEASRPDATATSAGVVEALPCSNSGSLPWTNVTPIDAEAACSAIGARLCTELEWQRACKQVDVAPDPVQQGTDPSSIVFIEAEDFAAQTPQGGHMWVVDTSLGYSGFGALRAEPNDGTFNDRNSSYATLSPQLDYNVEFNQSGTHRVWVLGWASNGDDARVHVGINGTTPTTAAELRSFGTTGWMWSTRNITATTSTLEVPSTGVHTINVWMAHDGFRIDAILLTPDAGLTPDQTSPNGCDWSFDGMCNLYNPDTCNGLDFDFDSGTPGDQDGILPTGQLASCFTNWGAGGQLHDMSGNVKEWTAPRLAGVNPLRGGSETSAENGLTCDYSFAVANDNFFFPNVGFRCCR